MAAPVTIKLFSPTVFAGEPLNEVTIREPNGRDFTRFGEPFQFFGGGSGPIVMQENEEAVCRYLDACIVHAMGGAAILPNLGLSDAMRVKEALLGFFTVAREAAFKPGSTPSSSPSG